MKLFIIPCLLLLLSSFSKKTNNTTFIITNQNFALNSFDTLAVYHITDSVAAIELKNYDEQSKRQTGVPRMVCHYKKSVSYDKVKNIVFVYYSFSDFLFYGNDKTETIKSTGFPDFISISYEINTKKIRILPEG